MHLKNIESRLQGFLIIIWNSAGWSAVYVNQTKLNVKLSTYLGASQKSGGAMWPTP